MEKRKNEVHIEQQPDAARRSPTRTLAYVLIVVGLLFLLWNANILNLGDIGSFFGRIGGSIGEFFGSLGGLIGSFFGSLGSTIGRLAGSLANLWPLLLIVIGVLLLFRRGKPKRNLSEDEQL